MKLTSVFLGLAMTNLLPAALLAQNIADTAERPAKPAKEKKICRREEVTGSMLGATTCHTASQWSAIDAQNAENAHRVMDRSSSGHQ